MASFRLIRAADVHLGKLIVPGHSRLRVAGGSYRPTYVRFS